MTVLFVPQTRRGELAKRLQHVENDIAKVTGSRVRVVERGGTMVKKILHKSIPWDGGNCVRRRCLPCFNNDGKGRLQKKVIIITFWGGGGVSEGHLLLFLV